VHLACDGKGRLLSVIVTPGQRNDGTQLCAVLDAVRVPRKGRGRPRKRPEHLLADRGYGKGIYRRMLRARYPSHHP
jgi:transposase